MNARLVLKKQSWAFGAELGAIVMTVLSVARLEPWWAVAWGAVAVTAALVTRRWARRDPLPMPHWLWWVLLLPRPFQSPRRLARLLGLRRGERLLEIGPGIGHAALPIVDRLGSDGRLDVLDIQHAMLTHLRRRIARAGIAGIAATQGDAARLPYPDRTFDGAYLLGVLGEIPERAAALQELRRVVKPGGRLVVGEIGFDPDFIPVAELRRCVEAAGFRFAGIVGVRWSYLARFDLIQAGR